MWVLKVMYRFCLIFIFVSISVQLKAQMTPFIGVKLVEVSLEPKSIGAKMLSLVISPKGNTYVKFTPKENGVIQIQFCDSHGNIVFSPCNNGTGFSAGKMPKSLYLTNVLFKYKNGKITDAQNGRNIVCVLPHIKCEKGNKMWNKKEIEQKTKYSKTAQVLPTTYNGGAFHLEIKLNLSVAFNAIIKEIKNNEK